MVVKSDCKAKKAYIEHLKKSGYSNCRVAQAPADIVAEKNGEVFYFEIKKTTKDKYFGAATLTEWAQACATPNNYVFVVAKTDEKEQDFVFYEFTPEEFMGYSTLPPFKIYFNIDLNNQQKRPSRRGRAIKLNQLILNKLLVFYSGLQQAHNNA